MPKTTKVAFPTRVALPETARTKMVEVLNERLADFLDLERQAKQAHWNVKGRHFQALHLLFDQTAALAVTWADDIAERAVQLGGVAEGTVQVVEERTQLVPAPLSAEDSEEWITVVAEALACCANAARANIEDAEEVDDAVTTDLLTRIVGEADKQLWMVEAHQAGE
jgi:starvation-inducible DNA-binding protein